MGLDELHRFQRLQNADAPENFFKNSRDVLSKYVNDDDKKQVK